jgi:hypothetical protein
LYAQEKVKAQLSKDHPPPAGSRPRKSICTQQPELSTITAQLFFAMNQLIAWYCSEPRLAHNRTVVLRFRLYLEAWDWRPQLSTRDSLQGGASHMKQQIPVPELAAGIRCVKGVKHLGQRSENWSDLDQARLLVDKSDGDGLDANVTLR